MRVRIPSASQNINHPAGRATWTDIYYLCCCFKPRRLSSNTRPAGFKLRLMRLAWDAKDKVDCHDGGYHRERSADLYHTSRWTRLSRSFRNSAGNQLCAECRKAGVTKEATCVDHIIPWPVCGVEGFFDRGNLQALCDECNHLKGQRDKAVIREWRTKQ